MAKYNVKHTCGCEVEHNLFGKSDSREYKIGKLQEEKCYNCQQKDKIEELLNSGKYEIKEVHYSEYAKDRDSEAKTMTPVPDTYNKASKTIQVVVKKVEGKKVVTEETIAEELDKEIENKLEGKEELILSSKEFIKMLVEASGKVKEYGLNEKRLIVLLTEVLDVKYNKQQYKEGGEKLFKFTK